VSPLATHLRPGRGGVAANVSESERAVSAVIAGGLLVAAMFDRRRTPLALLAAGLAARAASGYCPMYGALGVQGRSTKVALAGPRGNRLTAQITIAQPPETVYAFWRSLDHLSSVLPAGIQVDAVSGGTSRWSVVAEPGGVRLAEWTAELINDLPEQLLAWRTTPESSVAMAGSVSFRPAPARQGTEVRVVLQYAAPLGRVGTGLAALTPRNPTLLLQRSLDAIKRYLELGRAVVLIP